MTAMTRTPDQVSAGDSGPAESGPPERESPDRTPADIESDIRRTRDRMEEDINAIGEKLSPERIKERAKAAVRRTTRTARVEVLRMARENPVPAALVGLGLAWLLKERRQAEGTPAKHPLQQRTHRASQRARRAGTTLRSFFDDNPLIGAAGVLVLGATVGALLPRTQKEDRLMGQARDELVGRAEGALQETMTQKGEVTHGTERE